MAKIINGLISGTVGPLTYYSINGVQMVRQKAVKVKQSKRTKIVSSIFAKASRIGADIRESLSFQLLHEHDQILVNNLSGAVFQTINRQWDAGQKRFDFTQKGFSALDGFQFDQKNRTSALFRTEWNVTAESGKLSVSFDQVNVHRDVTFPKASLRCEVVVGLTLLRLRHGLKVQFSEMQMINIRKTDRIIDPFSFTFDVPSACLCIVTMFLRYYKSGKDDWKLINTKRFNPGCIQKAMYTPGNCTNDPGRKWIHCPVVK